MPSFPPNLSLSAPLLRPWLECWALGAMFACIAYGIVIVLFVNCFQLLLNTSHTLPKKMKRFLYTYTVVMFLFSTADCVLTIGGLFKRIKLPFGQNDTDWTDAVFWGDPLSSMGETLVVLSIWAADGFMLWRCVMLYEGINRPAKIAFYAVITLVALNALGESLLPNPLLLISSGIGINLVVLVGFGMYGLLTPATFVPVSRYQTISAVSYSTMASNTVIAGMIVGRILYHQRYLRQVFGKGYGSIYTKILTMCVESAALIVVLHAVYLVIANEFGGPVNKSRLWGILILLKLFVPVSVIAPLLIIYRVASGKAWPSKPAVSANSLNGGRIETLQFRQGTDQPNSIIEEDGNGNLNGTSV